MSILGKLGRFFRGDSSTAAPLALPPASPQRPQWRGDAVSLNLGQPAGLMMGGFSNPVTGHGMPGVDSRMASQYRAGYMTDELAIEMWRGDEIAHRIISMLPREALEPGIEITIQDEERTASGQTDTRPAAQLVEDIAAAHRGLGTEALIVRACEWERLFGGAAIWAGANDFLANDWSQPLDLEAPNMRLQWLDVIRSRDLYPHAMYEDAGHPKYGQVAVWRLSRVTGGGRISQQALIHESRLHIFRGRRIVDDGTVVTQNLASTEFGDGIMLAIQGELRRFYEALDNTELAMRANGELVWQHDHLAEILGNEGEGEDFKSLVAAMNYAQSILRARVVGAGQTLTRQGVSLAGLSDLVDKYENRIAGISGTPRTKLFGEAPGGLGNNGAGPQGDWDETKRVYRKNHQLPAYEWVTKMVMRSLGGEPRRWKAEGRPYRQPTDAEKTAQTKEEMGIDVQALGAQIVTVDEVRARPLWRERYSLPDPAAALDVPDDIRDPGGALPPGAPPAGPGGPGPQGGEEVAAPEQPKPAELALTGPQALALSAIAEKVAAGTLPPASGVEMAVFSFKVPPEQAQRMMPAPAAKPAATAPVVADSKGKRADAAPPVPVAEPDDPALTQAIARIDLITPYQIRALAGEGRESLVATLELVHGIPCELADRLIPEGPGEYGGDGWDAEEREDADRDDCDNPIRGEAGMFDGCAPGEGGGGSGVGKDGAEKPKSEAPAKKLTPKQRAAAKAKAVREKARAKVKAAREKERAKKAAVKAREEAKKEKARAKIKAAREKVRARKAAKKEKENARKAKREAAVKAREEKAKAKKEADIAKKAAKLADLEKKAAERKAANEKKVSAAQEKLAGSKTKTNEMLESLSKKTGKSVDQLRAEMAPKPKSLKAKIEEDGVTLPPPPPDESGSSSYRTGALQRIKMSERDWDDADGAFAARLRENRLPPFGNEKEEGLTYSRNQFNTERHEYSKNLSSDEKRAALYYSNMGDRILNTSLRNGEFDNDEPAVREMAKNLDAAIEKHRMPQDTVVARTVAGPWAAQFAKSLKKGSVFSDKGYTSTSSHKRLRYPNPGPADEIANITIKVPKGAKAAPIPTAWPDEGEFLLPRNSRFRVNRVKKNKSGEYDIEVELMQ